MNEKKETFEEAFEFTMIELIRTQAFYANMLLNMVRKVAVNCPTMGVCVKENVELCINPYFFLNMTVPERMSVLAHEANHVLGNHLGRFKELEPTIYESKERNILEKIEQMQTASGLNKAGDYAINEFFPDLPKQWNYFDKKGNIILEPKEIRDEQGNMIPNPNAGKPITAQPCLVDHLIKTYPQLNIQHNMNLEYYYEILKQAQEEDKKSGKSKVIGVLIDDHSLWTESNADPSYVEEKIKAVVNRAVEASGGRDAGNIPGNIKEMIDALFYKPRDWRSDLKRFVARATEIILEESRSKRHRRFGILYPGMKSFPKIHIVCGWDVSGSCFGEEKNQFLAEIKQIAKNNVQVTVVTCDTQVNDVFDFNIKKLAQIQGGGGTMFDPLFRKCDELNPDGIIFLTDAQCFDKPKPPKAPLVWAIVGDTKPPINYGKTVKIVINKRK
jgi:predicted metal-dependent peptidase